MTATVTCCGRTVGRSWIQEWYETASKDAGRRVRELRKAGFQAKACAMGSQVTSVGRVRMTLVDIRTDSPWDVPAPARVLDF